VIDTNAYVGAFAFRALRGTAAGDLLRRMDRYRIAQAWVSNPAAITYRNAQPANEELAQAVRGHADRLIPFAVINPGYAGWRDDLARCRTLGMRGLRLYPRWHNYKLTDAACVELAGAGLPVTIPMRVEDRRQQSWLVDVPDVDAREIGELGRAAPGARIVVLNASGGVARAGLPGNCLVEISLLRAELDNEIGQLIEAQGEERVVFGTGQPFHYVEPALLKMELLGLGPAARARIESGNARRLLGVTG